MTIQLQEEQLVNEDGMWYGIHVTVQGTSDVQDALAALVERYGEDRVYGSQSIINQFNWSFGTIETDAQDTLLGGYGLRRAWAEGR